MNFQQRAQNFPPILIRLLSRSGKYGEPLTTDTIAARSGLSPVQVEALSICTSWDGVPFDQMVRFLIATNCDLENTTQVHRLTNYLRSNPSFKYLRAHPKWGDYYRPMLLRWRESFGVVTQTSNVWPPIKQLLIKTTRPKGTPK